MRRLRQSASGRRLWRSSRTLFVASLILAVAVVASIAAAATGGTGQTGPSAWTWGPTHHGSGSAASAALSSETSAATAATASAGPTGTTLTGPTGNHVVVGQSSKNDTSAALRSITPIPVTPSTGKQTIPVLPLGKQLTNTHRTNAAHVQTKLAASNMPATQRNFEGIDYPGVNCGCAPPDTNGAVGATQYVQIVNTAFQVFDKSTGNSVLGPVSIESVWSGFGGVCQNNGEGDPVVALRQDRQSLGHQSVRRDGAADSRCVAVSTSPDATGSWNRYDFDLGSTFGNNFYDYPKLSTWPDAYYMSANVFNAGGTAFLGSAAVRNRPELDAGRAARHDHQHRHARSHPTTSSCRRTSTGSILPPAGAPNPFTEIGTNPTWKVWRFHVDFTNPSNSTFTQAGTLTPDPLQRGLRRFGGCLRAAGGCP